MSVSDWLSDLPFSDLTKAPRLISFSYDIANTHAILSSVPRKGVFKFKLASVYMEYCWLIAIPTWNMICNILSVASHLLSVPLLPSTFQKDKSFLKYSLSKSIKHSGLQKRPKCREFIVTKDFDLPWNILRFWKANMAFQQICLTFSFSISKTDKEAISWHLKTKREI